MTQHANNSVPSRRPSSLLALMAANLLAACLFASSCRMDSSGPNEVDHDRQILAGCRPSSSPASLVLLDGSGSSASKAITDERMDAVESVVRSTTICSGRLRVVVFGGTSAATKTLFDDTLQLQGATDAARLKRVPKRVGEVMQEIKDEYTSALRAMRGTGGSDIVAEYRLAAEWIDQLGASHRLRLFLFSDGFQTVGVKLGQRALSAREAELLANKVDVPKLNGASVTVAGLGRVAGAPPRSTVVEGLVAFYQRLCKRAGAAECSAVTDFAAMGR